ncbi:MAG: bifunctional pyr operon transcriptional regulator/uracil phosphoribosyltransferase [Candidatus Omnitrophica bacterium CG1_02_44_16]|nr:MAG: bifunctional pyr operon transcriptional regulator/uracil phosphoribosyltransferase [Candidatus Omnitrophica bacterium CG1_02_44_16]PIY82896.1 MAG: bifunctional pyr operon transcriptional regulator/uracil phosphoribosyltransferase PyrR [Candidatus Omnitrophica bacterium CG_4_10_14_0_8_um_filter_44_12]PIZ83918.1 MAG: bifunctional pyr operon transcriptional regulator/uracil phosphoribosyltransferase PyrR [Candidatus Omnitrophica bacterium CG_4_10_14_0_2_um_filter_44_9]
MPMKEKARIMDKNGLLRTLTRMAHEILEKNKGTKDLVIVGIRTRGAHLAFRLSELMEKIERHKPPVGVLDITLYRDDLSSIAQQPVVHKTEIDFDIQNKKVILVDDVLYTGRTVRAALDELIDFGRPLFIQLAVLVDRGHRELPIRADYVGKNIPTSPKETVQVRLEESEGIDEVAVMENHE